MVAVLLDNFVPSILFLAFHCVLHLLIIHFTTPFNDPFYYRLWLRYCWTSLSPLFCFLRFIVFSFYTFSLRFFLSSSNGLMAPFASISFFFFYLLFIFTPAGIPVFASFYTLNSLVLSFYTFSLRFSFLFHTLLVYLFSCPVVMGLWCFELAPFAGIYFTCISIL